MHIYTVGVVRGPSHLSDLFSHAWQEEGEVRGNGAGYRGSREQ